MLYTHCFLACVIATPTYIYKLIDVDLNHQNNADICKQRKLEEKNKSVAWPTTQQIIGRQTAPDDWVSDSKLELPTDVSCF